MTLGTLDTLRGLPAQTSELLPQLPTANIQLALDALSQRQQLINGHSLQIGHVRLPSATERPV